MGGAFAASPAGAGNWWAGLSTCADWEHLSPVLPVSIKAAPLGAGLLFWGFLLGFVSETLVSQAGSVDLRTTTQTGKDPTATCPVSVG